MRVQRALATDRPIPERGREWYFLQLHARAERAYYESQYDGETVVIYGEGMYEDPMLGWESFVASAVSHSVPGDHLDNRELLKEPHAQVVADRLREHLAAAAATA
jgi:thioesterase domain-containing protein